MVMWRHAKRLGFLLVFGAILMATEVRAATKQGEPEQLILKPVHVPVADEEFNHHVTVYLIVPDQKKLYEICVREPHIIEAIAFYVNKFSLSKLPESGTYLPKLSKALKPRILRAIGHKWVSQTHAFIGALKVKDGRHYKPRIPKPVDCKRVKFRRKAIGAE